jgi:hypothetical protein
MDGFFEVLEAILRGETYFSELSNCVGVYRALP